MTKFLAPFVWVGACLAASVPLTPPVHVAEPVGKSFVSFSVEFSWWPEFAGNLSHPNKFTDNLMSNFKPLTGNKPYIRVGGNTQDNAIYDPDLTVATNRIFGNPNIPYPTTMTYGKSYFESYQTLTGVKLSYGFNLGANATNGGISNLKATLPLACAAISEENFGYWELGNEADHYGANKQNRLAIRDAQTWNATTYVADWKNRTDLLATLWDKHCGDKLFTFIGPSFAGLKWIEPSFAGGLNEDHRLSHLATHHYIAGSQDPTVTLQGVLMNHTMTASGINSQARIRAAMSNSSLPYIIGEGNSLFSQGRPGASDVFGASLWTVDFSLLAASIGIHRIHLHQGVDYSYSSWAPVHRGATVPATRAPYYGTIAAAATIGRSGKHDIQVTELEMETETESAYAIYQDGSLARIAIINMDEYNATSSSVKSRPTKEYTFSLLTRQGTKGSNKYNRKLRVQRLIAAGSDALSGITWDGISYNYELDEGRPVRLRNVTGSLEHVNMYRGSFRVSVPHSSYALVHV
ncbi:hypothetical protein EDB81DRAFT_866294 [Dactylonectria macrodidyma]|uniref:Beta-glucuronidase C-terminal domain-containing protein n=1 Tax=Dactylonectria macrodidyma TaxID=307937 RepID=A0A9P9FP63_9HYPO|nr:hypothetical protein EDB81DRAFT_866294 [Dactylonectria macrodidyma]